MKLTNFRRIIKEDYEEDFRSLIDKLGYSLNSFCQEIVTLFNKNITIEDNLLQEIKTLTITTATDNSTIPRTTTQFKNNLSRSLKGLLVINVENLTNTNRYPTGPVQLFWSENNNVVTISRITGLESGYNYKVTVLTIGG